MKSNSLKKSVFMFGEMHYVLLCVKILLDLVYTGIAVTQPFSFYVGCAGTYMFSNQPHGQEEQKPTFK